MKEVLEFFNLGLVGILIGGLMSAYFYFKSLKRALPRFSIEASHQLSFGRTISLPEGLNLTYEGHKIPHIASAVIRFWNGGNTTLDGNLISNIDGLRIETVGGEFIYAKIHKETNPVNQCKVALTNDRKTAFLSFDYLDANEGVCIGLLHTSSTAAPIFKGTIKGHPVENIELRVPKKQSIGKDTRRVLKFGTALLFVLGIAMASLAFVPNEMINKFNLWISGITGLRADVLPANQKYVNSVLGFLMIALGGLYAFTYVRRHPPSLDLDE